MQLAARRHVESCLTLRPRGRILTYRPAAHLRSNDAASARLTLERHVTSELWAGFFGGVAATLALAGYLAVSKEARATFVQALFGKRRRPGNNEPPASLRPAERAPGAL